MTFLRLDDAACAVAAQYKFIVDNEWKYAPDQPAMHDERGIINNVVEVQEYVPDHLDSLVGFEPPPSPPERCTPAGGLLRDLSVGSLDEKEGALRYRKK